MLGVAANTPTVRLGKFIEIIKKLPVDLGQGCFRHRTKSKNIAFSLAGAGRGRVMDVGCGDGFWSRRLEREGWQVVMVDKIADDKKGVTAVDAERPLPFDDDVFDLVWSVEVIEHVAEAERLVKEMRRVVGSGGSIVVTTPNSNFWLYRLLKLFGVSPQQVQNEEHKHFFNLRDIQQLFPGAEIYGFFPYNLIKFKIRHGVSLLSPTFVIREKVL